MSDNRITIFFFFLICTMCYL